MKTNGFFRNTLAYGLQSVLPQLLSLVLLPLFTNAMSTADYAVVNLAVVFSLFLSGIAHLQLPSSIGRFYFDYSQDELPAFISTILYLTICTCLLTIGSVIVFGDTIIAAVFPKAALPFFPLFLLSLLTLFNSSLCSVFSMLLQAQEKAVVLLRISFFVALVYFP